MAARENQGLQIALMIFALLVVFLAVMTYLFFSKYQDQLKKSASATATAKEKSDDAQKAEDQNRILKELMGFSPDEALSTVQEEYTKDIEVYAASFPEDARDYRKLVQRQYDEIRAITRRELAAQDRETDLNERLKALEGNKEEQVKEYKGQMTKFEKDLIDARATFKKDRTRITSMAEGVADELASERDKIQARTAKMTSELKEAKDTSHTLQQLNASLNEEKQELLATSFEVADGKVVWANQRTNIVWLNLGSADGLRRQVTFSVFDVDENDAAAAQKKGSIEVTQILDEHLAEARITDDSYSNPILPQDKIYSPIWHRGRQESFAVAGFVDIDGDNTNDREQLRRIIESNGGVIDAEALADGTVSGKLSHTTRYLILGEEEAPPASSEKVGPGLSKLSREAQTMGVEKISVGQFLDYMGWTPEPGATRKPSENQDDASGKFRKRNPARPKYYKGGFG